MIPIGENTAGFRCGFIGAIEDAGHAHFQGGAGGARQVVDYDAFSRVWLVGDFLGDGKRLRHWFAIGRDRVHIDNAVEEIVKLKRGQDAPGVGNVGVGKDQFPAGQRSDDFALGRVGPEVILQRQVMHKGQIILRIYIVARL